MTEFPARTDKDKVHTRNVMIGTYACTRDSITVEGEFIEKRLKGYRSIVSGERYPPQTIHHMIVRMLVMGDTFTIAEIEGEMPVVPHTEECRETLESLEMIKGLTISPGFTNRVKKLIGGTRGCVHLTTLLLAMAPAAVQGFWASRANEASMENLPDDLMQKYLIDTCRVWRKNGKAAGKLKDSAAK